MYRDVTLRTGKTYKINHEFCGRFTIKVTGYTTNGIWVHADIVAGRAEALKSYNVREAGDVITLRHELIMSAKEVVDV